MALLLGKGVEGICNRVMVDVETVYCIGWVDGGREGSNCCMGRLLVDIGPPHSCLSLLEQLDIVYRFLISGLPFI